MKTVEIFLNYEVRSDRLLIDFNILERYSSGHNFLHAKIPNRNESILIVPKLWVSLSERVFY